MNQHRHDIVTALMVGAACIAAVAAALLGGATAQVLQWLFVGVPLLGLLIVYLLIKMMRR